MMRRALLLPLFFPLFFTALPQHVNVKIIEGFRKADTGLIAPFLSREIELIMPEKEGLFSAEVALKSLGAFLKSSRPSDFTIKHSGESPSGSRYSIGVLTSNAGVFRVYLLFAAGAADQINEIRIETDE